jgi:hypothetical protein
MNEGEITMVEDTQTGLSNQHEKSVREHAKRQFKHLFQSELVPDKVQDAMAEVFADQMVDAFNKIPNIDALFSTVEKKYSDFQEQTLPLFEMIKEYGVQTEQLSSLVSGIQATFNSPLNKLIAIANGFLERFDISIPLAGIGKLKDKAMAIFTTSMSASAAKQPTHKTSLQHQPAPVPEYTPVTVSKHDHTSQQYLFDKGSQKKPDLVEITAFHTFKNEPNPFAVAPKQQNASAMPVSDNPWENSSTPPMKASAPLPPVKEVVAYDAGEDRDMSHLVNIGVDPWKNNASTQAATRSIQRPPREETRNQAEIMDPWREKTKKDQSKDKTLPSLS